MAEHPNWCPTFELLPNPSKDAPGRYEFDHSGVEQWVAQREKMRKRLMKPYLLWLNEGEKDPRYSPMADAAEHAYFGQIVPLEECLQSSAILTITCNKRHESQAALLELAHHVAE
jgi:hypothetical protein